MPKVVSFYHADAALHDTSISARTPSVQNASFAVASVDIKCKTVYPLLEIAQHWWQECSINANETSSIIARDGSRFYITMTCCTCTSETLSNIMITAAQMIIVAVSLHQLLQWAPGCVDNLVSLVHKTVSAIWSYFETCSHSLSAKDYYFPAYKEEACHATQFGLCNICLSLDYVIQSSTFCSQDHYKPYQKLTFYNSAIGKECHNKALT